ncbi:MAG: hypothetical protein II750_03810 [Bacteroidaceae bacterium]|nr:hypothetical protein [Bacteroidaceae bacterium]
MKVKHLLLMVALTLMSLNAMATIVDGVRQKPTYTTSGFVENEEVYLYNVEADKFWVNGNDWGTQASLGETGLLVRFVPTGNGDYYLQDYYNNAWYYAFFDSETQMYVDRGSQSNYYWQVEDNGTTFRLYVSNRNPDYGFYSGLEMYVGLDVESSAYNTALSPLLQVDTKHYIDWAIVTKSNFEAMADVMAVYEKSVELKDWIDKLVAAGGDASSLRAVYLNESSTIEEMDAAIEAALPIYVQALIDNAPDKTNVDVTVLLTNPDYEQSSKGEYKTKGWTIEAASGGNVRTGGTSTNICYEAWNNAGFDIYQELTEAPVGVYEIEVQGFYRYGRDNTAWNAYLAQNVDYVKPEGVPVYIYMNNNATNFVNVYGDSRQITTQSFYSDNSSDWASQSTGGTTYYFPNGMESAAVAFSAGMYKQSAFGLVAKEGDKLRLGVKGVSNQLNDSWVIWDNFKLIYRGFQADVIKPVLEAEMASCQSTYMGLLMGKSQYAAMTQALADAQTAIDSNDGESMFNALNALYDAKDPALVSKDLFLAQEVSASLQNLTDAISAIGEQKLSKAVVEAANTLKANIEGNLVYEDADIEQLKQDVSNAISNINYSISVYGQIPDAVTALNTAAGQKAAQTWIDDAATMAGEATAAYNDGTYTDAQALAKIDDINTLIENINNSAAKYSEFNEAIGRLEDAIQLVTDDGQHVSKNMMAIANAQLTNAKKVYDEGSIADENIPARIKSIDETIIPNLTKSVVLYQQLAEAITTLKATVDAAEPASKTVADNAATLLATATDAYNEGTIDDSNVAAKVTALNDANTALQNSVALYAQLPPAIADLEAVVGSKAAQTVLDAANTLLSDSKTGYAEGTIEDADVEATVSELNEAKDNVTNSAAKYSEFNDAIGRLEDAIQLVTDDGQHVSKNMMAIANAQLTNAKKVYDEGSIADENIPARIKSIDETIIPNLTKSVVLYQQLADAIANLKSALDNVSKTSAKTLSEVTALYDSASAAYDEGTIGDDEVAAKITEINNGIDRLATSEGLYSNFSNAVNNLKSAINSVKTRLSETMLNAANAVADEASSQYATGSVDDDKVEARIAELNAVQGNLGSAANAYDAIASAQTKINTFNTQYAQVAEALTDLGTEIDNRYLTPAYRTNAQDALDDYTSQIAGLNTTVGSLNLADMQAEADGYAASITTDHRDALDHITASASNEVGGVAEGHTSQLDVIKTNAQTYVEGCIHSSQFIVELTGDYATFCSEADLDFTEIVGVKAFVAVFDEDAKEVHLSRVLNVPAGTGIVLIGDPGTYTIAEGNATGVFTNELKGVSRKTVIANTEGAYTNYIFANGSTGVGFYAVKDGTTLAAGKAYMPLRTAALSSGVKGKGINFVIDDDTPTAISDMAGATNAANDAYYTVGGVRVEKPAAPGIYIKNGKKVLIK